jgi:hypothetical protein
MASFDRKNSSAADPFMLHEKFVMLLASAILTYFLAGHLLNPAYEHFFGLSCVASDYR